MGFQNENKLKVGALVKATINNKVVEAKVISIGFNRVTLRSEKGNEVSYRFNSEKFLKWFKEVPLNEVAKNHAETSGEDLLKNVKIVTSGPSVKDRTSTSKEPKEDKYKLMFDFGDVKTNFMAIAEGYVLAERKGRLGQLMSPLVFGGNGFHASLVIMWALSFASQLKHHSDHEWLKMLENRNPDECWFETFDHMDNTDLKLFCDVLGAYAQGQEEALNLSKLWAQMLPKNQKEAKFVAQLLCDGGINKYNLSRAGLTENLLKDIYNYIGLANAEEVDEYIDNLDKEEAEAENLEN
ncbi:hypothetical protein C2R58_06145 [Helicobacter pylori]|uniref:hypothetical protein n=1 Tax=Helicobacter pylori TaxID=210 RepID=UPI000D3C0309|nr:hypothetical protein [Helicobacter pylori]PUD56564.1 hypothetical protein C2R58_06145 [Helicobacter pylori]WRG52231.1 hypothetical protein FNE09_04920 [Helicobacter pylori]